MSQPDDLQLTTSEIDKYLDEIEETEQKRSHANKTDENKHLNRHTSFAHILLYSKSIIDVTAHKKAIKKKVDPSMGGLDRETSSSLPSPSIKFSSDQGIKLFANALSDGYMNGYFELASQFTTQAETTYCGLASLTMILNSLSIDPQKKWKGQYQW
eukprot:500523_1